MEKFYYCRRCNLYVTSKKRVLLFRRSLEELNNFIRNLVIKIDADVFCKNCTAPRKRKKFGPDQSTIDLLIIEMMFLNTLHCSLGIERSDHLFFFTKVFC